MKHHLVAALSIGLLACGAEPDSTAASSPDLDEETLPTHFRLPPGAERHIDVDTVCAAPAELSTRLSLPGTVGFHQDNRAAVVARLDGVVTEVRVDLGEAVEAGALLAVLHCPELARARSASVLAIQRLSFAQAAFDREKELWDKGITSEENYFLAEHELAKAGLELQSANQELEAFGASIREDSSDLARFELRAPMAGVVVAKDAVLGEATGGDHRLFEIADMDTVWVDARVPASQLGLLTLDQPVTVFSAELDREIDARLAYVDPRIDPGTQTGGLRVEVDNTDGVWRPGLFVRLLADVQSRHVDIAVPVECVHRSADAPDDHGVVFVTVVDEGWEAREVRIGFAGTGFVEIASGLRAGERVARTEGLLLKSVWLGVGGLEE